MESESRALNAPADRTAKRTSNATPAGGDRNNALMHPLAELSGSDPFSHRRNAHIACHRSSENQSTSAPSVIRSSIHYVFHSAVANFALFCNPAAVKSLLKIVKRLLPLLISLAVMAYLFGVRTDPEENLKMASEVSFPYLMAAAAFTLFSFLFAAWRLKFLVNLLGHRAGLSRIMVYTLVGHFYNNAIPGGAVGGDAVKALYLAQVTGKKSEAFAAVLVDRLCGLFMLATIALVMLAPTLGDENSWQSAIVIVSFSGAAFGGIFGMTSRRVRRWFPTHWFKNMPGRDAVIVFDEAMQVFRGHKKGLITAMLISAVPQLGWIGMHVIIGQGMGIEQIGWSEYAVLVPVAGMIGALPISFGGWGVGEAAMAHFMSLHAKTDAAAKVLYNKGVVLSAIGRLTQLVVSLLGLAASWALPKPRDLGAAVASEDVLDSTEEADLR